MRVSKSSPAPFGKILQRAHAGQPVELYQPASCIYRERGVNRVVHIIELFRQWCFIFLNSHMPTLIALNLKMRGWEGRAGCLYDALHSRKCCFSSLQVQFLPQTWKQWLLQEARSFVWFSGKGHFQFTVWVWGMLGVTGFSFVFRPFPTLPPFSFASVLSWRCLHRHLNSHMRGNKTGVTLLLKCLSPWETVLKLLFQNVCTTTWFFVLRKCYLPNNCSLSALYASYFLGQGDKRQKLSLRCE